MIVVKSFEWTQGLSLARSNIESVGRINQMSVMKDLFRHDRSGLLPIDRPQLDRQQREMKLSTSSYQ